MPDTDRNLLFGVLALHADVITHARFVEVCSIWANQKQQPIARLLLERGWMTEEERQDVERLVERKLRKHGGDVRASLAEAATGDVRRSIPGLDSPEPVGLASTTAPDVGRRDRYTLTRIHATGGIGRVWLARDDAIGRDVAMKDLRPERADSPSVAARFLKEARVTGQLEHPGIVPVYELGQGDDGRPYYTMRFVRGRTLRDAVVAYHEKRRRGELGPLDLRELLSALVGVCNAVAYAHSRGVVHRDLKPANVVLGDFGEVIVLDWGLAKLVGAEGEQVAAPTLPEDEGQQATMLGQVLGTPAYLAPEQADGQLDRIGPATDVHGLGAIVYEVLTGEPPFDGTTTEEVLAKARHQEPARPRDRVAGTPRALEAVCLKCLRKRPEDRYATAREVAEELRRFLADEPVTAYREPVTTRLRRWGQKRRTLVASVVAVLVVTVPLLAFGLVRVQQARLRETAALERSRRSNERALKAATLMAQEVGTGIQPLAQTEPRTVVRLLERATQVYDEILDDPDPPLQAREGKAQMLTQYAGIFHRSNQTGRARDAARGAIEVYDGLLADYPGTRAYRVGRANARHELAQALMLQRHVTEAIDEFRASIRELEEVGADQVPEEAAGKLASGYTVLALMLDLERGDSAGFLLADRRSLELRRRAAAAAPESRTIAFYLVRSLDNLGTRLCGRGEMAEGLALLREARKVQEGLVRNPRSRPEDEERFLVRILNALAEYAEDPEEAKECIAAAAVLVERHRDSMPHDVDWQRDKMRFQFYRDQQKPAKAMTDKEQIAARQAELKLHQDLRLKFARLLNDDPEYYDNLANLAMIEGRIAAAHLALANLGEQSRTNRKKAREMARSSLAGHAKVLARDPKSVSAEKGTHFSLYTLSTIEFADGNQPAGHAAFWEYVARQVELNQRLAGEFPGCESVAVSLRDAYVRFLSGFPTFTAAPSWAKAADNAEAVAALLRCFRCVADPPAALPERDRQATRLVAMTIAPHLRYLGEQGKLPDDARALLAKLPPAAPPLKRPVAREPKPGDGTFGPRAEWKAFVSKEAGFRVLLPGEPKETIITVPMVGMEPRYVRRFDLASSEGVKLFVECGEFPELALHLRKPDLWMGNVVKGEARGNRLLSRKGITLGKERRPGLDFLVEKGRDKGIEHHRGRIFLVGNVLYQLGASGPDKVVLGEPYDRFFASFEVLTAE